MFLTSSSDPRCPLNKRCFRLYPVRGLDKHLLYVPPKDRHASGGDIKNSFDILMTLVQSFGSRKTLAATKSRSTISSSLPASSGPELPIHGRASVTDQIKARFHPDFLQSGFSRYPKRAEPGASDVFTYAGTSSPFPRSFATIPAVASPPDLMFCASVMAEIRTSPCPIVVVCVGVTSSKSTTVGVGRLHTRFSMNIGIVRETVCGWIL